MLLDTARRLAKLVAIGGPIDDSFILPMQELLNGLQTDADGQASEAVATLFEAISPGANERAKMAAMACGALIERGAAPGPFVAPLVDQLRRLVPGARRMIESCAAAISEEDEEPEQQFAQAVERHAAELPACAADMALLNDLFPPMIALFSVSPEGRRAARQLVGELAAGAPFVESVHWLSKIVSVLDDEPFVAIDPAARSGLCGRMSGVSDNFQLNVLLMDEFPRGFLSSRRVSKSAAAIARGDGPQASEETVTGCWNLYTWSALGSDGSLPASSLPSQEHWIWNEGSPADILSFDETRVILLGSPAYVRQWRAQRDFSAMKASLGNARKLTRAEVDDWLRRLADATVPGRDSDKSA